MRLPILWMTWGACVLACAGCAPAGPRTDVAPVEPARSAIFLHPDGMGANTWAALRLHAVGPDGRLAWDQACHWP